MCFFFLSFSASSWASFLFSSSWKSFKLIVINQFLASFEATFSSFSLGGTFSGSSLFKRPGNHANWSLNSEQLLQALFNSQWVWNAFLMIADHYQQDLHLWKMPPYLTLCLKPPWRGVPWPCWSSSTRWGSLWFVWKHHKIHSVTCFTVHCLLCDMVDVEVWLGWGDHCLSAWPLVAYKSCEGARSRAPPPACHWKPAFKPPPGISRTLHSATYCVHKTTEERVQLLIPHGSWRGP